MTLIVITRCSGSGKSTMAANLSKMINAIIIPQDSFYKIPFDNYPYDKMKDNDVEGADLIDWNKMCETIVRIQAVTNVNIIVEGHCVFSSDLLVELADVLIYLYHDKSIIKKRFMDRYHENYTTEQLELKGQYFEKKTWPFHIKYENEIVDNVMRSDREKFLRVMSSIENGTDEIVKYLLEEVTE